MNGAHDLDSGLLGIALSDSDAEPGDEASSKKPSQEARTGQSEADFQEVKRTYHVKVENGEIWTTVQLPLGPQVPKPEAQALLHAVEELYFFRRFAEGARFARSVIDDDAGTGKLDDDTLQTLVYYEKKCRDKKHTS
ncbi:hypothetical protein F5B22DRAFT_326819 [Xylaria bambusicola]|uniref:uncharacterized protein n=1 Tax=Xylaria bambusicola TaxID=326684 RepID=UPI0020085393|nr:uncharacterized protein F5B22DRAFT_326819 [Xylaria bambusicola]KAI0509360.1 hypothetical protein F5B22DRAFT_326819 [Xylaria bambusicola]